MPPPSATRLAPRSRDLPRRRVGIVATGSYAPTRILHNRDFADLVDTTDEWIRTRTGMSERRIAAPGESSADLANAASRAALARAALRAEELELIIVATFTPDRPLPATAGYLQHALGARHAAGFDLSIACSGFLNALMTAESLLAGGMFRNALVVGVDVMSSVTDYGDRETCVLFGDGAGAAVLAIDPPSGEILDHIVRLDGSRADLITIKAGGSREPIDASTFATGGHLLRLDGRQVFKFAVKVIGEIVEEVTARNGISIADIDWFVPHQANLRIIEAAASKLGIPDEKLVINIERYGNTSAASVPLALDEAVTDGRIQRGQLVCLVAFGAGLSWGATLLRW